MTALSLFRSEERFSRNAETDLVCRLLLEKKNDAPEHGPSGMIPGAHASASPATARARPPTHCYAVRRAPRACPLPLPTTFVFFFNDTATTEIYTLSLHDALPI